MEDSAVTYHICYSMVNFFLSKNLTDTCPSIEDSRAVESELYSYFSEGYTVFILHEAKTPNCFFLAVLQ